MRLWDALKIDSWWKCVLTCGVALIAISLLFNIELVNRKHLLGIGIGMFIVGLANWMALKTVVHKDNSIQGFFYGTSPIHNTFTKNMQVVGCIICVIFGGLLIWALF